MSDDLSMDRVEERLEIIVNRLQLVIGELSLIVDTLADLRVIAQNWRAMADANHVDIVDKDC